jgi:hypothetical protein
MEGVASEDEGAKGATPVSLIAVLISVAALIAAAAHLIWPSLKIDSVTLALLIVAALPWLAPVFKSIELTGVGKVEFQERLREVHESLSASEQRVDQLNARVHEVESVITGATPQEETRLAAALHEYHTYLQSRGFSLDRPQPGIRVVDLEGSASPDLPNAFYDGGADEIEIARPLDQDRDVLFRSYTHHLLPSLRAGWRADQAAADLESGLADYYPCSFKGAPDFGPRAAAVYRARVDGFDLSALRMLANERSFAELAASRRRQPVMPQDGGEVWGGALWEVRARIGAEACDTLIARAWVETPSLAGDPVAVGFARTLVDLVAADDPAQGADVEAIFERRSMPL